MGVLYCPSWIACQTIQSLEVVHYHISYFQAHFGVNIPNGVPFNCSHSPDTNNELACYKWHNKSSVRLSMDSYDDGMCINVNWNSHSFDPILEDCINMTQPSYGYWYGGHMKGDTFPLGHKDINASSYLPGDAFGSMTERFWISTKGVAIVAKHNFALHLRIDSGPKKQLCLSSRHGFQPGSRNLSYSICRASNYKSVHGIVMRNFYKPTNTNSSVDAKLLSSPLFSAPGDKIEETKQLLADRELDYSYVVDTEAAKISPYKPYNSNSDLNSSVWIKSIDMDIPRLFKFDGRPHTLVNASATNLSSFLRDEVGDREGIVHVTDLEAADIRGQEYYSIYEMCKTFQKYTSNFISGITDATTASVMSDTFAGIQQYTPIVYLEPANGIADKIKQLLHSSLMGYNLINIGEIPSSLTEDEFIRMLQVSIFLPVVQFSHTVLTQYNSTAVINTWKKCNKIRKDLRIAETIREHVVDNQMIPLYTSTWWQDVQSRQFHSSDQFVFNDRYLVVPVLEAESTTRHVFFPGGLWLRVSSYSDPSGVRIYQGPVVVTVVVRLDEMLIFDKVYEDSSVRRDL